MSKSGFTSRCADRATKSVAFESYRQLAFSPDGQKRKNCFTILKLKEYEK